MVKLDQGLAKCEEQGERVGRGGFELAEISTL